MASPPRYATHGGPPELHRRTPLMVGGAAVLIAVVVLGTLLLSGRIWGHQPGVSATPGPQVTAPGVPTTAPTTAPTTRPKVAPTALPGFGAGPVTGGSPGVGAVSIASVRAADQAGFDRFVIDFGSSPQNNLAFEVLPQATSTFITDPKGEQVTLQGTCGVEVNLSRVSNWTSLPGSTDLHLGLPAIKEARQTGDFEGNVRWSLGIDGPGFVRVMTLTSPTRLVVDVQS